MKLISLNIWGGRAYDALVRFIEEQKDTTDVFCFQEVFTSSHPEAIHRGTRIHILEELEALLPEYTRTFYPMQKGLDIEGRTEIDLDQGLATFVRKEVPVLSSGTVFTRGARDSAQSEWYEDYPSAFGYIRVLFKGKTLSVLNFYGFPIPGHKLDTPERLEQSRRIVEFAKQEEGEVIICGDFNLFPQTGSIAMLENDFTDLIKAYDIRTTRSTITPYYGTPEQQNFADYTFVSKGITVSKFDVPSDCVASDHLPMILESS